MCTFFAQCCNEIHLHTRMCSGSWSVTKYYGWYLYHSVNDFGSDALKKVKYNILTACRAQT
jgi:hypothetical protein